MSLRTRLIIAFLLLSVVPLTAVTLLSYKSSVDAVENAAQREATERASDVSTRMDAITADLGRKMDRIFVSSGPSSENAEFDPQKVRAILAPMLGETAALIDRVEFRPVPVPRDPSGPPVPPTPGMPPAAPSVMVIDVPKIVEEARRQARGENLNTNQTLAPLLERSIEFGLATAGAAMREAGLAAIREATNEAVQDVEREGRLLQVDVKKNGRVVGKANATLNLDRTLKTVLAFARRDQGELPFAIDRRGKLYTPNAADTPRLESLGVLQLGPRVADGKPRRTGDWIVVAKRDAGGIIFGIARPIGQSLREVRRASLTNLALGLGVIGIAVAGIFPISHRMTQHLASLNRGVQQLAGGDFSARVPVKSVDEFGALATAFNQMAADLERNQTLAVERERLGRELELSRQIQTEMLPRGALRSGPAEIAGVSIPAREVGGDFFNYFPVSDGRLALLVGDVSGKGVSAALLMANVQATLRARLPHELDLAQLAQHLDVEVDQNTPPAVYLTLFLGILEQDGRMLRYVNAGHNPQFVVRRRGGIVTLSSTGLPIALYAGHPYREAQVSLEDGDLLFFYTDGLVETENAAGDQFGAERLQAYLTSLQASSIDAILERLDREVRTFRGGVEPLDDATMMALRVTLTFS
ncbi:MAG: SpoIIE family protein phosphatase [Vicinamibacterales bacterium]